ncbi:thioesterase II family protein [Mycobacterium sherrisii]|uniref:thioesterase II family protein n=1 Tax=Mycobacterium sherrisii TaxID=243061 RepID=UPI0039770AF9
MNGPATPIGTGTTPALATLYIFPHAGGSATFYVPLAKAFSADIQRVAVQYPARGDRGLTQLPSIPEFADEIFSLMAPGMASGAATERPVAFFGHSMGGLLAFEVALRFQAAGQPIEALFVSACAAPGHIRYKELQGSDLDILTVVAQVTGTNPDVLANDDFAARILPTLQSVRAIAGYDRAPGVTVSCPIHAFVADNDIIVAPENMTAWADRTTAEFTLQKFAGDHFYLTEHLSELAKNVEDRLLDRRGPN